MAFSCPKCGAEIAEGRTFCLACGAYLAPHAASGPAAVGAIPGSGPQVSAPTRAYGPGDSANLAPTASTPPRTGPAPDPPSPIQARTGPSPNASVPFSGSSALVSGGDASSSASSAAHMAVAHTMQAISGAAGPMASRPDRNTPSPARSPRVTGPPAALAPGESPGAAALGLRQGGAPALSPTADKGPATMAAKEELSSGGDDVGMAATLFAMDAAVVEAAPGQNDAVAGDAVAGEPVAGDAVAGEPVAGDAVAGEAAPGQNDPVAGDAVAGEPVAGDAVAGEAAPGQNDPVVGVPAPVAPSSPPRHVIPGSPGLGALNVMSTEASVPISASDVGDFDAWDEKTPTDAAERSWASDPKGGGPDRAQAPEREGSSRRVPASEPRVPSFSADAVVPSSSSKAAPTPAQRGAAAGADLARPPSSPARDGASTEASLTEGAVLLSTADVNRDDTPIDVVSVRVEAASYAAAVDALKRQLRLDCASLGGDALMRLRLEREEGGRVVYGTGMVVHRRRR